MIVEFIRQPDDPICLRASVGGLPEKGYYLTIRGNPKEVLDMLKAVTNKLQVLVDNNVELKVTTDTKMLPGNNN
jgi:hypothetical protein